MSSKIDEPVGELKFGANKIGAYRSGKFIINLINGGEWILDIGEITKLDYIFAEFESIKKGNHERMFWRTNGSKIIQVQINFKWLYRSIFMDPYVVLVEGGTRTGYFYLEELPVLRKNIRILTSEGAPYGRSIRLLDVIEESRKEELVTHQQVPLNNRNSNSPLIVEREFSREAKKLIYMESSFGVGVDYYITLNLETRYGINREDKISERVMVRMEAQPGEHKIYTITWKEVWISGHAMFDMGDISHREKVRFRLKSGLEADIKQEIIN